ARIAIALSFRQCNNCNPHSLVAREALNYCPFSQRICICEQKGMSTIISFRDLDAWQVAMELTLVVFRSTERFPKREWYGLAAEMRKSAVSIPSNIAEGHSQRHGAYVRHLWIAVGSHSELSTQAEISFRLDYLVRAERNELGTLLRRV